jgi:hypothetical protein
MNCQSKYTTLHFSLHVCVMSGKICNLVDQ